MAATVVSITIPDDPTTTLVVDALCALTGVQPTAANAKAILIAYIVSVVNNYQVQQATVATPVFAPLDTLT